MPEDVIATLDAVIDAFNASRIAYALCGGLDNLGLEREEGG